MPINRAMELLQYYREWPPTHIILRQLHGAPSGKAVTVKSELTEEEAISQMRELSGSLGQGTSPLPPHLREMADWAITQASLLKN